MRLKNYEKECVIPTRIRRRGTSQALIRYRDMPGVFVDWRVSLIL
jgi:hypothetical protein